MIKLFYDTKLCVEAKSFQQFPLLEVLEKEHSPLAKTYGIVSDLTACDFGIIPMDLQLLFFQGKRREVEHFIARCKAHSKNVLVFSGGDFGITLKDPNVITVRLGGFDSKLPSNTFIMPPFIADPYARLSMEFGALQKASKPLIGFVGHSSGSLQKWGKEYLLHWKGKWNRAIGKELTDAQVFYPSSTLRHRYLKRLLRHPGIEGNFIFRSQYRAGVRTEAEKQKTTEEFYQNMQENLYTFCLRGTGNFSVRFYETLAMGRIPVVVDTDCRFPFSEIIDWKEYCVLLPEKEAPRLAEKLLEFHHRHSPETLRQIQEENRRLWQNYFTKDSYFQKLATQLKNYL